MQLYCLPDLVVNRSGVLKVNYIDANQWKVEKYNIYLNVAFDIFHVS